MKPKLKAKQLAFCQEYLIDLNATQAAIRAGYSERTARQAGAENLSKPVIQSEVKRLMEERAARNEIDADTVLGELLRIARADIGQAFNPDGSLKSMADMPEEIRRAISGVDVFEEFEGRGEDREQIGFTKKVRFWDKVKALEMLGRHLRLFIDKVEHSGPGGGPIVVESPRPSNEQVAEFTSGIYEGFRSFRDNNGDGAELDRAAIASLSEVIGEFAGGQNVDWDFSAAERIGSQFARGAVIRKNLVPPASFRGIGSDD